MTAIVGARIESSILSAEGIKQIQRIANRLSALQFRDNLKYRFEGRSRGLKFARRSNKYNEGKRKKTGQAIPLVYTGEMRKNVLTKARVTATAKQGRMISTTGARGFRSSEWRSMVRKELEQITQPEINAIQKQQEKTLATLANDLKYHKKRKSARRY
jgi:hypothetical protein